MSLACWLIWLLPNTRFGFGAKRLVLRCYGLRVGDNVQIWQGTRIVPLRGLSIGDDVAMGYDVLIRPEGGLTIGNQVLIGHGTKIITANHVIPPSRAPIYGSGHEQAPVVVGNDVWIGANAVILPGVALGEGCVVAAGAVVTRDVSPFAIVGGVPARVIRMRD